MPTPTAIRVLKDVVLAVAHQAAFGTPAATTTVRGAANGYASLNSSSKVVQDPASASTTPAANAIPKAGAGGTIADGFLSSNLARLNGENVWTGPNDFNGATMQVKRGSLASLPALAAGQLYVSTSA
jgi:hypothetical protein